MKRLICLAFVATLVLAFSGCKKKEPTLGEKLDAVAKQAEAGAADATKQADKTAADLQKKLDGALSK